MSRSLAEAAIKELQARKESEAPLVDLAHGPQAKFVCDLSRFSGACTTRRAGKSTGLGYKHLNAGKKYKNSFMPFIGLTRESAKNIIFPAFLEISNKHKLGLEFKESDLTISVPGNSKIQLFGADMKNFIQRLRGIKTPCASIDEGQSFRSHLEELVDDILTPATADFTDGQVNLTGTPGPVPKGYFYECSEGLHGFNMHRWTVYDNPYFPNPREFVADLFLKKRWTKDTPTYRREWLGEWVADPDALVYRFNADRDVIDEMPHPIRVDQLFYVLGVDLGYSPDPSAFVLSAFSPYDRHMYVIETHREEKMTVGDVAERIKYYLRKYPTLRVVADLGGQGKMIGEEIRQRYGIPLIAAEKSGKAGFIEIMNSDMHEGKIKVLREHHSDLIEEWSNLIWDSEKEQRVEDARYPNHLADAALYNWRYCYNYAHQPRPEVIERGSERELEIFWERESERGQERMREDRSKDIDLFG